MNVNHFTTNYRGIARALVTGVGIGLPFQPPEPPPAHFRRFNGLWDTGATATVITQAVVDSLGLKPVRLTKVFHAQGADMAEVYLVSVGLPNQFGFPSLTVTKGVLQGFEVLIGMDIISRGDFCITNHGGITSMSFQCPSVGMEFLAKAVGQARSKANPPPAVAPQAPPEPLGPEFPRNRLCPCGSGLKFKRCCGKAA